jgi:hypothetical protein
VPPLLKRYVPTILKGKGSFLRDSDGENKKSGGRNPAHSH